MRFKNGLDIITDGERWRGRGSGGWTEGVLEDGGREGEEACCFKSRGDNREDEKSMEGSMEEMSF